MVKSKYTVGSLFAGVGGICGGFASAGGEMLWANEYDKNACITYRANFEHNLIEGDCHDVDPMALPKVDVITAGFPCQAFSVAGYRKGFRDDRGDLFFETMRFIEALKPKAILLENVKNLSSHDKGNTLKVIKDYILHSNYSFIPRVLNTMDYGNIPQNRERIYIVGFRDEACYNDFEMHPEAICSRMFSFPKKTDLTVKIQDLLEKDVDNYYYYNKYPVYDQLKTEIKRRDTVYQWRRVYVRENKSAVCPTLTANMGTGGHNVPLVLDRKDIRKLTPLECFRFQGFPKDFKLPRISRSHLYKQAGNSVSVPVVERIAKNIFKALDGKYSSKSEWVAEVIGIRRKMNNSGYL